MSIDKKSLKSLAEAALREERISLKLCADGEGWQSLPAQSSFRSVSDPAVVIDLISEIETLHREAKNDLVAYQAAIDRQEEIRADRDEVRQDNEVLRKELESHKRMLLAAACEIGAIGQALGADMDDDGSAIEGLAQELRQDCELLKTQKSEVLIFLEFISKSSGDKWAVVRARDLLQELGQ
ncbi:hypothetical protein [Pseudomonas putida]|uniref:hypothetical protein n=1 Tax=Pseudomonas putida TaxID=303 RepID=UPI0004646E44|nr:hypothetical protein [Pseudomonas putida]KWW18826.1 hypothetical protein AS889_04680 [Pseudomonas putida]